MGDVSALRWTAALCNWVNNNETKIYTAYQNVKTKTLNLILKTSVAKLM